MSAVYNENGRFPADWLEDLIRHDLIAPGVVERRSIEDLKPADVDGPGQRHFFAGIGGWSYACRLAGVPDDADIWTGSCPCQPFSDAGKRGGIRDARHLWPAWRSLIIECRPPVILGEQVASRAGLAWLDDVFADLERCGYSCGAADLCAAGVGAPHIRQRMYFVAHLPGEQRGLHLQERRPRPAGAQAERSRQASSVADSASSGRQERWRESGQDRTGSVDDSTLGELGDTNGGGRFADQPPSSKRSVESYTSGRGALGELGDASGSRGGRDTGSIPREKAQGDQEWINARRLADVAVPAGATRGFWAAADWLQCRDGKARPVEPGTFPLAHGVPGRVGLLSGYGNAINAPLAATFIRCALEAIEEAVAK